MATSKNSKKSTKTVARYTEEQITVGLARRAAGGTNGEVAKAAGVKSPNYFTKLLKAREVEIKKAAKASARKAKASAKLPKPGRTKKANTTLKTA